MDKLQEVSSSNLDLELEEKMDEYRQVYQVLSHMGGSDEMKADSHELVQENTSGSEKDRNKSAYSDTEEKTFDGK